MPRQAPGGRPIKPTTVTAVAVHKAWPAFKALVADSIPPPTAWAALGVDPQAGKAWVQRSSSRRRELAKIRAEACIDLLRSAREGDRGWQAKIRILESLDGENWLRSGKQTSKAGPKSAIRSALDARSKAPKPPNPAE